MGYETKLYVVLPSNNPSKITDTIQGEVFVYEDEKGSFFFDNKDKKQYLSEECEEIKEKFYCQVLAMIDVSKAGYNSSISNIPDKESSYYFYAGDSDTPVTKDGYGDSMRESSLEDAIVALEKDVKREDYRRFKTALALLKACVDDYDDVKVLYFGY